MATLLSDDDVLRLVQPGGALLSDEDVLASLPPPDVPPASPGEFGQGVVHGVNKRLGDIAGGIDYALGGEWADPMVQLLLGDAYRQPPERPLGPAGQLGQALQSAPFSRAPATASEAAGQAGGAQTADLLLTAPLSAAGAGRVQPPRQAPPRTSATLQARAKDLYTRMDEMVPGEAVKRGRGGRTSVNWSKVPDSIRGQAQALKAEADALLRQVKPAEMVESAISRAGGSAGELRDNFRRLAENPKAQQWFTEEQLARIERVAREPAIVKGLKSASDFNKFILGAGGAGFATGDPVAAGAVGLGVGVARAGVAGADRLATGRAAGRALEAMRPAGSATAASSRGLGVVSGAAPAIAAAPTMRRDAQPARADNRAPAARESEAELQARKRRLARPRPEDRAADELVKRLDRRDRR